MLDRTAKPGRGFLVLAAALFLAACGISIIPTQDELAISEPLT